MREFKINDYITLKLEDGKTKIYVYNSNKENYEFFNQCIYVLLKKEVCELEDFLENIESVDELAENLDHSSELRKLQISEQTQFWVHCSNMQAWAENDYDTRLIHSNLAFPLLKKLTEAGEPLAKKVFKEEIAKRFSTGFKPVMIYLMKEGYIDFLSNSEIETVIQTMGDKILDITELDLSDENGGEEKTLKKVPEIIKYCLKLKKLEIAGHRITELPEFIINLKSLTHLDASNNSLKEIPNNIGELNSLKWLNLANNRLERIPESIGNLTNLKELNLGQNRLESLPDSIGNLKSLRSLLLYYNRFESIPDFIENLESLESLSIFGNKILNRPTRIGDLKLLRDHIYIKK